MTNGMIEVTVKDLEQVAGGNFFPNAHSESEYASVGIKVVTHILAFDEFWYQGKNIGHDHANAVFRFKKDKGRMPDSVDKAVLYQERLRVKSRYIY